MKTNFSALYVLAKFMESIDVDHLQPVLSCLVSSLAPGSSVLSSAIVGLVVWCSVVWCGVV